VWKSILHGFPPIVAAEGAADPRLDALRKVLLSMPGDAAGRTLLKALNLDGFVAGSASIFDSIRALARSVPDSGVPT
jgi:phosphonate transport system substrate-binding protein